jgi:hypothetical protein
MGAGIAAVRARRALPPWARWNRSGRTRRGCGLSTAGASGRGLDVLGRALGGSSSASGNAYVDVVLH